MDYIDKLSANILLSIISMGSIMHSVLIHAQKCDGKSVLLESRYKNFEESIKNDVTDERGMEDISQIIV